MHISATEFQTFQRCRRLWNYTSLNRLSLEPRRPNRALSLGLGVHEALEAYYGRGEHPAHYFGRWANQELERLQALDLDQEALDDLKAAWELGYGMLDHYAQWAALHDNFTAMTAEQEFMVPIQDPTTLAVVGHFVGRFDGIIRSDSGQYYLLEHKTFSTRPQSADWLQLDEQTTAYTYAANVMSMQGQLVKFGVPVGTPIRGALYNGLRKKLPAWPATLKNGELSRAMNIDTTYETYLLALEQTEQDPNDYQDILEKLLAKGNTFFHREYRLRGIQELRTFREKLYRLHQEMSNRDTFLYHNPTSDCLWRCDFRQPCIACNVGGDEGLQLRRYYLQRPAKGQVYDPAFGGE